MAYLTGFFCSMLPVVGIVIGLFLPAVFTPPTMGVEKPILEPLDLEVLHLISLMYCRSRIPNPS